jgi:hypothetical protein
MKITNAALKELTPDAVRALKPNEILAAVLFAKIAHLTKNVDLIPAPAYKVAIAKVKNQIDPEGGLKKEIYDAASPKMKELAQGVRLAFQERNTSDKLIELATALSAKPAVKIPDELRGYLQHVDREKGGFKETIYDKYKRYPGFDDAAKELRDARKEQLKNPVAKKAAPAKKEKDISI